MKRGLTTIIILAIVVIGGYLLFSGGGTVSGTEVLSLDDELNSIELTNEEKEALKKENLTASGDDELTEKLKTIRTSDDVDSIEKDLNDTNFLDLDKELAALEKLLGGL